ncbi:26S proteasome non-ATPase regulatory subunit 12, partial [Schistosoma japonicum]
IYVCEFAPSYGHFCSGNVITNINNIVFLPPPFCYYLVTLVSPPDTPGGGAMCVIYSKVFHGRHRLLEAIVEILAENSQWARLNEHLILVIKKQGEMKRAVSELELIVALRNVTEGKIYVEIERARLTKEKARIKESHGDIEGVTAVLQGLQVETFDFMEKKEKVEFMLEQMRLCLAKKDFIRTQIISNKISKIRFYNQMIDLNAHDSLYLNISKNYWKICNFREYKKMKKCDCSDMLKAFTTQELLRWDEFYKQYESALHAETDVFFKKGDESESGTRWYDLHLRVIEHNICVISGYYTKI